MLVMRLKSIRTSFTRGIYAQISLFEPRAKGSQVEFKGIKVGNGKLLT